MKIIPSSQVGRLIPDGASVLLTGITLGGYAEEAFLQIERSFLDCGHPRDLTLYWQASVGDMATKGLSHICHEGLLAKGVGGHINGCGKVMTEFCRDNKAAIYNWPQGVCVAMLHAIAAKTPGVVTKIGLKTFMDPRYGGGRMNAAATEDLIDLVTLRGEEWLLYKAPKKIDVTLIRGTVADERGNIAMTKEGYKLGQLAAAEAARATGGIVICQVERIVKSGTLHPRLVEVPGVLVDYVYVAQPEYHWQTAASQFNPVFAGDYKVPLESIPPVKFDIKKVMARRAAMELREGYIVNLGIGTPEYISAVASEEGCSALFTLSTEAGNIGGVPTVGNDFGCCWNGEAMIETAGIFDMYDGGSLDAGCLGFLEVGPNGDLNSSKKEGLGIGVGGFMNIAGGAKHVVFISSFTAGKPEYQLGNGELHIIRDGTKKKFIRQIAQISFSAEVALDQGKDITYVTERVVFKLTPQGLMLTEIAPGIDLQRDILDQMEFTPLLSDEIKPMPAEIFFETWGGLKAHMTKE
ncbi:MULTISPECIES: acyl CoA:acetate/3-ketoacid CoA transferase [Intestinimonas]|jgi:propionate CoA-transferase